MGEAINEVNMRKVAILGGGAGAISTAFYLSDPTNSERFDITIYQMGWRLGGLGASGRNMEHGARIEEHGLHLWGGFYENAFAMMLEIYKAADRPKGSPLSVVFDPQETPSTDPVSSQSGTAAFKPFSNVIFGDYFSDHWSLWKILFPENAHLPGVDHTDLPDAADLISEMIDLFWQQFERVLGKTTSDTSEPRFLLRFTTFLHAVVPYYQPTNQNAAGYDDEASMIRHSLQVVTYLWRKFHPTDPRHQSEAIPLLVETFDHLSTWLWDKIGDLASLSDAERHIWQLLDLNMAVLRGLIVDNVVQNGFEALDDMDLRDWLQVKGRANLLSLNSVLVRGFYDYFFSFKNGDPNLPLLSAGSALVHMIRLVYTYKGAIFWKMQAGMGDTIFAPAYEALKKRGVKFKFFHYVKNLHLSSDKRDIDSIEIQRQVELKPEFPEYLPFVQVKGLACWPNFPLVDQIQNFGELKNRNLENPWGGFEGETFSLERGKDFDLAVIAISKDSLIDTTKELMEASPAWQTMVLETGTVDTLAAQLWFNDDAQTLGWTDPPSVLTGYQRPHSTWCDMSHLLPREDWPADNAPKHIAYLCGPVWRPAPAQNPNFKPEDDVQYELSNSVKSQTLTREWMCTMLGNIYKKAALPVNPSGIDFRRLYAPNEAKVSDLTRLDDNYTRINITPPERYCLSLPGAQKIRVRDGVTPFRNLYAAGDWVYTLLAGCVEAAVMSGMLVARTITGSQRPIVGYWVRPRSE